MIKNHKLIYKYAEKRLDLHLGVGDKFLINKFFPKYEKDLNVELYNSFPKFLSENGYKSKKMRSLIKATNNHSTG